MTEIQTLCQHCGCILKGRRDKKFCDDHCRNSYHNRVTTSTSATIRFVHRILKHNRKILTLLNRNPGGKSKVHSNRLSEMGFDFRYHTHVLSTPAGNTYYFCYDLGYARFGQEVLIVTRKPDKNKKAP